jgi:hypothetical protein
MIHVILDTTTYTSDPKRHKGPFRALERLCKGNKVQLHIPYFVKNEYITQQFIDIRSHLAQIRDFAENVRAITSHDGLHTYADGGVKKKAVEMRDGAVAALTQEFEEWMKSLNAKEQPVKPAHGERVAKAYFNESPPFRSIKNRNDFPDAFIWQTILDLAAAHNPLHVVATDKGMYKPAAKTESIKAYKTLEEFIATDECQKALVDLAEEVVTENLERAGPVWSKYSGGTAVIVLQKPSKPLLAANRRQHRGPSFVLLGGEQQEVVLSLMVPLRMVMCRELLESSPERAFSKQNQL